MKNIYTLIILALIVFTSQLNGQVVTAKQYEKKANEAFSDRNYNAALEYYLTILYDDPNRVDLYWNTAEAARELRHQSIAARYYDDLAKTDSAKNYPLLTYRRAIVKKSLGNYDAAIDLLKSFAGNAPVAGISNISTADIQAEIDACEWAKTIAAQPANYEIIHMSDTINTVYTDIAPIEIGNTLYYTSTFIKDEKTQPVTNIFSNDFKNKSVQLPINSTKSGDNTAHFTLTKDGNRVYYNICRLNENGSFHCQIYTREKASDGTWKDAVRLDTVAVNLKDYTATQPNVGYDETKKQEYLYFVSNRPGGKGGLDIWYAPIQTNGQVGAVQNLSNLNTSKDDMTPYFYNDAQRLFFSSEGYKSLGGFDVYHAAKTTEGWSSPENAGAPLNSGADEMFFTISNSHAYFVCNKKGGMCASADKDCICNDIYKYDIKVDLKAETFLASTTEGLKGCKLQLIDLATGETVKITENFDGNNFAFPLDLNKRYRLVGSKYGYQPDTVDFDTRGIWVTTTLYEKLELRPGLKLDVFVFDKINKNPLNGAKMEIREGERLMVSKILDGHTFSWTGLEFGKTYVVTASKEDYSQDTVFISVDPLTNNARLNYTANLYLTPFTGLPVTLYFDNDRPFPGSGSDTLTNLTYGETYVSYKAREPKYLSYYSQNNKVISSNEYNGISSFFRDSVDYGHNKLMEFCGLLEKYLASGQSISLVMQGFASPLAKNDYNIRLSKRRISSVINHINQYNGGSLSQYIRNGRLQIRIQPNGEELADRTVSDAERDPLKSIYSVGAMKERKVIIKEITAIDADRAIGYDPKIELKGYLDFDADKIAALDAKSAEMTKKGGTSVPSDYNVTSKGAKTGARQKYEVVLIDALTGDVIKKEATVEIFKKNGVEKEIGHARRSGEGYKYELVTGNNYLIKGNVAGYNEATESHYTLATEGGESVLRDTLMLTPFAGMPLPLFFDNDHPNPNTHSTDTKLDYEETYDEYYTSRRQFIKNYNYLLETKGSIPSVVHEMEAFFNNEVKLGYDRLVGYTAIMKDYLKRGYGIEILLEGFASPLANADYNEKLTARRVKTVYNYLKFYNHGNLKKYLDNGKLKITLVPSGESKASPDVSDDAKKPQLSIYSLPASRERKVVIQDIRIIK